MEDVRMNKRYLKYSSGILGFLGIIYIFKIFLIPMLQRMIEMLLVLIELYKLLEMPYLFFGGVLGLVLVWYVFSAIANLTYYLF